MEKANLKRKRSEESPYTLQTKIHVNQKIIDSLDSNKMKEIHGELNIFFHFEAMGPNMTVFTAKTTNLLFQATRSSSYTNSIQSNGDRKTHVSKLVMLFGNGQIESTSEADHAEDEFLWVRRSAKCCDRKTYVQSDCTNCQNHLCEECGFSCTECGQFICNSCVTIFGSGDADHPICEKCSIFV